MARPQARQMALDIVRWPRAVLRGLKGRRSWGRGCIWEELGSQTQSVSFIFPERPITQRKSPRFWGFLEKGPAMRSHGGEGEAALSEGHVC